MRTKRTCNLLVGLAALGLAVPSMTAHADGYSWTAPSGALCTGGDTSQPTVLQSRESLAPGLSTDLSSAATLVLSNVYPGTVCTLHITATPAAPTLDVPIGPDLHQSAFTTPQYSCPLTSQYWIGAPANEYACVGASVTLVTHFNVFTDDYDVYASLDSNEQNGYSSWSSTTYNINDNNNTSFPPGSIGGAFYLNQDGANFHTAETNLTETGGSFHALCPGPIPGNPLGFLGCTVFAISTETVHIGIKATDTFTYNGTGPYCFYGEFKPEEQSNGNSGSCTNP